MSLRDQILSSSRLPTEAVHVDEWGCEVLVRALEVRDVKWCREAMKPAFSTVNGKQSVDPMKGDADIDFALRVIVRSVYDHDGNRVFQDDDTEKLLQMGMGPINQIGPIATRLSRLNSSGQEESLKN